MNSPDIKTKIVTRSMTKRQADTDLNNILRKKIKIINNCNENINLQKIKIKDNSFFQEFDNISSEKIKIEMSEDDLLKNKKIGDDSRVSEKITKKKNQNSNKEINYIELDVDELANVLTSQILNKYVENNKELLKKNIKTLKKNKNIKNKKKKFKEIKKFGGYYNENDEFIIPDENIKNSDTSSPTDDMEIDEDEEYNEYLNEIHHWDDSKIEKHKKELLKSNGVPKTPNSVESKSDMVIDLEYSSDSETYSDSDKDEQSSDLGIPAHKLEEMTEEEIAFWKKLSLEERENYLKLEKEIEQFSSEEVPEKYRLLKFPINLSSKSLVMKKIEQLSYMDVSDTEYFKLNKWVDGVLNIPFGKYVDMPIKVSDGHQNIYNFLYDVNSIMEDSIYGHIEAKNKILQVVSQWISNPQSMGNMIALQGPPGIGKTSLVKNGIAQALQRPFSMIALGGATDSSFLEGHNYTYEGSTWGRIANIMMESKCMNPVIFFDELDKISETKHGEEIVGVLTHLTDQTQNNTFYDKYFSGIDIDLSRVLFVFSYNDDERINPILKDRLIRIPLKGFSKENKVIIAKNYLIPELCKNVGMDKGDIIWSDDILKHIISNYTSEEGVRELRRHIETIYLKTNMLRFIDHPENDENKKEKKIELTYHIKDLKFPYTLTSEVVDKLITKNDFGIPMSDGAKMMYI
jgi:hypothetical protein